MDTVISDYYDSLENNLYYLKSLKLKDHMGDIVAYCCAAILVDDERCERDVYFNPRHLRYVTYIFENTSDPIFHIWCTRR